MTRLLLFIPILLIEATSSFAQSYPGNVSANLRWWLKSNAGVFENAAANDAAEDGDAVYVWADQSTILNNATSATSGNQPIYRNTTATTINGYPVLRFSGNQFIDGTIAPGIGDTESFNIFLVFKQTTWTSGGTTDGAGSYIIDRPPPESQNLISLKMVPTNKYFYQRRDNAGNNLGGPTSATSASTTSFVLANYYRDYIGLGEGIYLDGRPDVAGTTPSSNMAAPPIRIGRHAVNTNGGITGDIAEVIVYDNISLTAAERSRIQSYLAIKYGITLNQTTATDYVRSDGAAIYSAATFTGYLSDVAGIGRDDNAGLSQTTSKSQNLNSVVTISSPSNIDVNNEFLVWGSDNGSLTVPSTASLPAGILRKLSRVWRVAETGDVGTVTVAMDLSAVPGSKTAAHLFLLVDPDGFGTGTAATQYAVSSSSGSTFTFNGVDFATSAYFTIGTTNLGTPLPIELSDFNLTYENPAVVATWQTASELNNDYFTLERAGTDLAFDEIGRRPGAGTSKMPHSYSMIDSNPYEGMSYYRLKQTDFDGTETYSEAKSMFIEESERKLVVFPNPNDGGNLKFSFGASRFNLDHIEVYNQHGKSIESSYVDANDLREYSVDLQHRLSPGLYLLRVHYNGKDEFVKLMVQSKN